MTKQKYIFKHDFTQQRFEKFKENASRKHNNKYEYDGSTYKRTSTPMRIICRKHGEFMQKPEVHIMGSGCYWCGIDKIKSDKSMGVDRFIRRSKEKHGDTYDYSLTVYTNTSTNVDIICREHGVFSQNPKSHMKGIGCKKCSRLNSEKGNYAGWGRSKYINICKNKYRGTSNLYIVKCSLIDEVFYKVGITVHSVKKRFQSNPYSVEEIYFIRSEAGYIWDMEWRVKSMLKKNQYTPRIHFAGSTECFSNVTKPVDRLLSRLSDTNQIQLIA